MAVFVWGTGRSGELIVPTDREHCVPLPTRAPCPPAIDVKCGGAFTVVLAADRTAWVWGRHGWPSTAPAVEIPARPIAAIAAGDRHGLAIVEGQNSSVRYVVGWGKNFRHSLGSMAAGGDGLVRIAIDGTPVAVDASSDNSACIADGVVWVWGDNSHGKCGVEGEPVIANPTRLPIEEPVAQISLGSLYGAAITVSGMLYTWGSGRFGNLGHGDRNDRPTPTMVRFFLNAPVRAVGCTRGQSNPTLTGDPRGREGPHSLIVGTDGTAYACGTCHKGMLGNMSRKILSPSEGDELLPYRIGSPTRDATAGEGSYLRGERCIAAVSSSIHSALLTERGAVYTFGCASGGRMGIRKFLTGLHGMRSRMKCYVSQPTAIEIFEELQVRVVRISTSRRYMAAIADIPEKVQRQSLTTEKEGHDVIASQ